MNEQISPQHQNKHSKILATWLFTCAALVFAMVTVGAITRLTGSGLSMVEWKPLTGILPPLNDAEWQRVFEQYQQSPEYIKKNFWMDLDDYKMIFFWEWFHRVLGRFIGVVYGLPLLVFWLRGMIPGGIKTKLIGLFILGGLQGLMGWHMVQSGLVNIPEVSHYRLAAHLGLAFLIFSLLLWQGLSLTSFARAPNRALYIHVLIVLFILVTTIFWGAYTAGLDAGLVYNESFPKINGQWVPAELFAPQPDMPLWLNFLETHLGVQFMHRWLGIFTVLAAFSLWFHGQLKGDNSYVLSFVALLSLMQMGLGVTTLLSGVWLPVATMHQGTALLLLMLLVMAIYRVKP